MGKKPAPANLPPALRAVLERHGVVEAAPVPELGELVGSVRRLGGTLAMRSTCHPGGGDAYAATCHPGGVEMDGGTYDAGDADPALAVAEAFAQALTATFPAQTELFDAGLELATPRGYRGPVGGR